MSTFQQIREPCAAHQVRNHIDRSSAHHRANIRDRTHDKRVGLVILATDHTTVPDFARMVASARIGIYVNRIPYANPPSPTRYLSHALHSAPRASPHASKRQSANRW